MILPVENFGLYSDCKERREMEVCHEKGKSNNA